MLEAYAGTRSAKEMQQIPTEIQFFLNFYIMIESVRQLSCVRLFETPWTIAHQAHPSMGFSRQEYWSGLPCPPPGDLPDPGIEPGSPALQVDSLPAELQGKLMGNFDCSQTGLKFRDILLIIGIWSRVGAVWWDRDFNLCYLRVDSVQFSSIAQSCPTLRLHESHSRPLCPLPTPGVYSNSCPLSWSVRTELTFRTSI